MTKNITVIIPSLDEEKNLDILLSRMKRNKKLMGLTREILVLDGGSKDRTVNIAKKHDCRVIFAKGGKGVAIKKGVRSAKGSIVVLIDADLSNHEKEILLFAKKIDEGNDIVRGSRFIRGGGSEDFSWSHKQGNFLLLAIVNMLWRTDYTDLCYGYMAFKKAKFLTLDLQSEGFEIDTEISIRSKKKNLKVAEIPSFEHKRRYGEGKLNAFRDGGRIIIRIVKEMFRR